MLNARIICNFFFSKIVPALSFFLLIQQLYIYLSNNQLEEYSIMFAYCIMISSVISGWLCQSNLRYNAIKQEASTKLNSLVILILMSLIILVSCLYYFIDSNNLLSIILAVSMAINRITVTYFQSILRSKQVLQIECIRSFFILSYLLTLNLMPVDSVDVQSPIIMLSVSNLISSLLIYCKHIKISINKSLNNIYHILLSYVKYGMPMSIWLIISTSYPYLEKKLLTTFSTVELTDYFALSDFINRGAGMIFIPLLMYIHPKLMYKFEESRNDFFNFLYRSIVIIIAIALLGCFVISVSSQPILNVIFPGMNTEVIQSSVFIFLIPVFWQLSFLSHKFLEAKVKTTLLVYLISFSMASSCLMMYFLIPQYGYYGSIFSQVTSLALYILLSLYFSNKESNEHYNNC